MPDRFALGWLPCGLLLLSGCAGTAPLASPRSELPAGAHATGVVLRSDGLTEAALGVYDLTLDLESLEATVSLQTPRSGQATDDLYHLPVSGFLRPDSYRVRAVKRMSGKISLLQRFAHPFAAPADLGGVPSASNRADLGIAGRLLYLTDVASATGNSYFGEEGDPVVVNTALVSNPDAYWRPRALFPTTGIANTFPYQTLVDETGNGSRVGVSNGGIPTGNYGNDGWTGLEIGSTRDQWTGYGVLHQGQVTERELEIDLTGLEAAGSLSLQVAVLAHYNDPRGGNTAAEKKGNRLPPANADITRFAYRMPHGALDVERLDFRGATGNFIENTASASLLAFAVTDWDARATETNQTDLALDSSFTAVAIGESGLPTLAVCIPGVLGDPSVSVSFDPLTDILDDDTLYGGDAAADSGAGGDPLCFVRSIDNPLPGGQTPGTYTGLVRARDAAFTLDTSAWELYLDGGLAPIAGNFPRPETYQAFSVVVEPSAPPATGFGLAWGGTGNDFAYDIAVDSTGAAYITGYYAAATNFGGGVRANAGSSDIYLLKLNADGTYAWDKTFGNSFAQIGWAVAVDASDHLYLGGQIRGDLDFGGGIMSAPTNNDSFFVKFDNNGNFLWQKYYGSSSAVDRATGITTDPAGNVYFANQWSGTIDFGGGTRTGADTAAEGSIIKCTSAGVYQWDVRQQGLGADVINGVAADAAGNVWATGYFTRDVDLGGGVINTYPGSATSASDAWAAKYSTAGNFLWHKQYGELLNEQGLDVGVDSAGNGYLTGYFRSLSINFGDGPVGLNPGGGALATDLYLVKLDPTGALLWKKIFASDLQDDQPFLGVHPSGEVTWTGRFRGQVDLGLGPVSPTSFLSTFVAQYTSTGTLKWNSFVHSVDNPGGSSIAQNGGYGAAYNPAGDVWVIGFYNEHADLDPGPGTFDVTSTLGTGDNNAYVTKLISTTGLW